MSRGEIFLRKTNTVLKKVFSIVSSIIFGISFFGNNYIYAADDEKYDTEEILYIPQESYSSYYDEHYDDIRPEYVLNINATDFVLAENGDFSKGNISDSKSVCRENVLIWNSSEGTLSYKVDIPETGVYNMAVSYCQLESTTSDVQISILVDGISPYDSASRIKLNKFWQNEESISENERGNQIRPSQIQSSLWTESFINDPDGLFNDPLCFYFEKGTHEITFEAAKAYIALEYIKIYNPEKSEYYTKSAPSENEISNTPSTLIRIEGENAAFKSSSVLSPTSDKSSYLASPSNPGKIVYNTIGDNNWNKAFQTITWNIPSEEITADGWYKLGIKARQQYMRGFYSNRRIYIDGEVPYREFDAVKFYYDTDWNMVCPSTEDGNEIYIYLTAGEDHTITMEAVPGEIGGFMRELNPIILKINEYYRKILMITGPSPDKYTDYNVDIVIPELIPDFKNISSELKNIKSNIETLANSTGSEAAGIERMYVILDKCIDDPVRIPQYLSQLKDNVAAISSWIRDYKDQPLEIDYIEIASANVDFTDIKENLWESFLFGAKAFIASFFEDYTVISSSEGDDALDVWITLGRDQALAVKELVESEFIPQYGININLSIVQGGVTEAALAGKGPDIALFLGGEYPYNLAARGLLTDISNMDGFDKAVSGLHKDATVMYTFEDGVYAMPLQQSFPLMFYRKDILSGLGINSVPNTWDELIDLLPALQRNHLYAGLVLPSSNIAPSTEPGHTFALLMLQSGLNYYNEKNTQTCFDDIKAVQAFEKWTDFYTKYKFEQVYDAFSRFRDGTYPIVIQNYTFCNQLSAAAPEITGLWDFTTVPGTVLEDGTISHAANSSGSGAVIFKKAENQEAAWEFVKWFASAEVQTQYGMAVEGLLGTMGRYDSANIQTLSSLSWTPSELEKLSAQREELTEIPVIPASYAVTRNIMTAFRAVVNNHENPRDTITWYNRDINSEITRKRENLKMN